MQKQWQQRNQEKERTKQEHKQAREARAIFTKKRARVCARIAESQ